MNILETNKALAEKFGPISQPVTWYGINECGIGDAFDEHSLEHIINRNGIFAELRNPAQAISAVAYVTARLAVGHEAADLHWTFDANMTDFGVVATVGELSDAEKLLGKPMEAGLSRRKNNIFKAHFLSPSGLLATVRQAVRGVRRDFVRNRLGLAEVAIQEMLPEALELVRERTGM